MKQQIELGDEVQEAVTGMKGVVTGRCEYLTGCAQFFVQPQELKEGKKSDAIWFDEGRLKVLTKEKVKLKQVQAEKPGADFDPPSEGFRS